MRLAGFEVRAELGQGGSAIVYDADIDGQRVALKVLREELALSEREKQRFVDEARRMVTLDHPGLVKLLKAGVLPDGRPYLAMPYLEGRSLSRRLADGPLPLADAVRIFGLLALAVDALHETGIVHRDIKPENILLVDEDGGERPVLLDLGIARDVDAAASTTTAAGKIRGTPAYMAPERFFGTSASPSSDIYELGVTFYMMLVGRLPWGSAESVSDRLAPSLPDGLEPAIGRALARTTLRALSTRPEQRPSSAGAFADEIERAFRRSDAEPERTTEDITLEGAATVPDVRLIASANPPSPTRASGGNARLLALALLFGGVGAIAFALTRASGATSTPASLASPSAATTSAVEAPPSTSAAPSVDVAPSTSAQPPTLPAASASATAKLRARNAAPATTTTKPKANSGAVDPFFEDRK